MQRSPFTEALGLGLLGILLIRSVGPPSTAGTNSSLTAVGSGVGPIAPPRPRTACDRRMREASRWHLQAWRAVNEECEAAEAWDSALMDSPTVETAWRRETLALDRSGYLRHARAVAQQAAVLAVSAPEQYRAALLLAVLACEAGDHQTEQREAGKLMALAPQRPLARLWLGHAARCLRCQPSTQPVPIGTRRSPARSNEGRR